MKLTARLLTAHSDDCSAIEQVKMCLWDTPWYITGERAAGRRDSLGRLHRHGSCRWYIAICNCTHCPAYAIFNMGGVDADLHDALGFDSMKVQS